MPLLPMLVGVRGGDGREGTSFGATTEVAMGAKGGSVTGATELALTGGKDALCTGRVYAAGGRNRTCETAACCSATAARGRAGGADDQRGASAALRRVGVVR